MNTEIEVKFLDVDFDALRAKLEAVGATCAQPMRLMRRAVIQNDATGRNSYIRVRDEGDKVTLTHKLFESLSLHGASETEILVSDFDKTVAILEAGGLKSSSYQESKRETWKLGDVEVVLDEWPWLKPYIEIEGPSEDAVRGAAQMLGFEWDNDACFGDIMVAYRAEYPSLTKKDTVGNLEFVRFDDPLPEMFIQEKEQ